MGDKTENGQRRVITVYVEPIEIELDDDGNLLFSALQSAVPGASGLYFRGECKSSVKFDGKKLIAPADGWKDRKYFANLGCRSDFPFGSYANASRQFERSVNAVQRLFGKCNPLFDYSPLERELMPRKPVALNGTAKETSDNRTENMKQLLSNITQKQSNQPSTTQLDDQKITPLEQQFVDLARISTAKDTIIEQQRSDIRMLNDKMEMKNKELNEALDELSKSERRCNAKEEELIILRNLSKEQTYMCEKVNELTKRLLDSEQIITEQKSRSNSLIERIRELEEQKAQARTQLEQSTAELQSTQIKAKDLEVRVQKLQPLAERRQIVDDEQILTYAEMSDSVDALTKQNQKLENELKEVQEKYNQLNQIYTEVVVENTKALLKKSSDDVGVKITDGESKAHSGSTEGNAKNALTWQEERKALKSELLASENKVAELTRMVHALTSEAANSEHRATEAIATRDELRRSLDTKIQESVLEERQKADYLRHDLKEAQRRVAELNSLIADFSSDARNSRRDVTDLL
ncbi:unnamed protein product [Anisakis simplex]|uniref:TDP43_N domain-containing protein n=1 Tax=Anisakis simplex TaxID=6269 RepID=A0A158PMZ4_ANISI|nr:unnamed protein product [Anisakis simplex]